MFLNPIASPPTGNPDLPEVFQAIKSTCAQLVPTFTNFFKNKAAVIAPPVLAVPVLLNASYLFSRNLF